MFIKLTRLDNTPIWLNASFIVTVEPRKGGGTIVVPIGDGLDYEVREKAEDVLALLAGAPVPAVVPVPSSDCLTKTPEDVSPEPPAAPVPDEPVADAAKPERKTTRKTAVKKATVAKPRKRATKKATAAAGEPQEAASAPEQPPPAEPVAAEPPAAEPEPPKTESAEPVVQEQTAIQLTDGQIDRLRRMMPRTVRKLANTLMSQFKIIDALPVVRMLAERGVLRLDENRVIWIG